MASAIIPITDNNGGLSVSQSRELWVKYPEARGVLGSPPKAGQLPTILVFGIPDRNEKPLFHEENKGLFQLFKNGLLVIALPVCS